MLALYAKARCQLYVDILECVVFLNGGLAVMAGDVKGFGEVEFFLECDFGFQTALQLDEGTL